MNDFYCLFLIKVCINFYNPETKQSGTQKYLKKYCFVS